MSFSLSVVLPNLNDSKYLPGALDALLQQSMQPDEIIVVDDGSSDASRDIINEYARVNTHIRPVFNNATQGVVATMNRFAREASGTHIYYAAADDIVLPDLFAASRDMLEKHPEAGLCSSLCRLLDEAGNDHGIFASPIPKTEADYINRDCCRRIMLQEDSWIVGGSTIYRRDALLAEGEFRPKLHGFADGMMHRLLALKHGACFIPRPLMAWRRRMGGVSDTTNTNVEILETMLDEANRLMAADAERRFSDTYIYRWRRRTAFGALRVQLARSKVNAASAEIYGLEPFELAIANRVVEAGSRSLAELYLFARMRWFDIFPTARRLLRHVGRGRLSGLVDRS